MWREIATIGLGLGALYLAGSFGVPLVLAGGAVATWGKEGMEGLSYLLVAATAVTGVVLIPPYLQAVDRCHQLESSKSLEAITKQFTGDTTPTQSDLEYVEQGCADLPFA